MTVFNFDIVVGVTWTAECTAIDAFKHAGGDIVFGSENPFENVYISN